MKTAIKYSPVEDFFFRFMSDDELDLKCLYYCISGDSLVLPTDGRLAKRNEVILSDASWDMSFIYSSQPLGFVPSLALLFSPFAYSIGDDPSGVSQGSSDVGSDPSSSEED